MIKYILFDLDGVLVDARELHYEALNRALKQHGYTITRDEHLAMYDGLPTRKKLALLTEKKGLPAEQHDAIWYEKQLQTRQVIEDTMVPDPAQIALLQRLRDEGYHLAVCSNSVRETVEQMLTKKGIRSFFDFLISNEDVTKSKPHPEMYLHAFLRFGAAPAECLAIEDSHHGRESAHAAGAHVCGVAGPQEVTYECVAEALEHSRGAAARRRYVPKWQGRHLRIVIPMAGEGKSFQRAGYTFPKPLVDVLGKPMVQWVVENINAEADYIFVVLQEHYERYNLQYLLSLIAPGCQIVQLAQPTQGAALSVLAAKEFFDDDHPLAVVNCDQVLEWNSNEFFYAMAADGCDGGIVTFTSTHPKWSYVRTDVDGFVVETAEKKPISNHATAGVYYFAHGCDFVRHAETMIASHITTNGEYFVCPVYNQFVQQGAKIRAFQIEKLWSLSTPEDVLFFQNHYPEELSHSPVLSSGQPVVTRPVSIVRTS